jgi:hypothetical protein
VYFDESDVVRHQLVQRIIRAYDEHKARVAEEQMSLQLAQEAKGGNGKGAVNGSAASNGNGTASNSAEQPPAETEHHEG